MTEQALDPAALDKAASAHWVAMTGCNHTRGDMAWENQAPEVRASITQDLTTAITAYQQAMAAQVREAVEHYENCCINYGMNGDGGDVCRQYTDMDNAQRALLRLLGAAETEAER